MKKAQNAIRFASFGAGILALSKLFFGILSGSMMLIASAIDSLLDVMVSVFNLVALKTAEKPADKDHNYGHGKAEAIAALGEGLIIAGSGVFIVLSSIKKLIFREGIGNLEGGIAIMILSLLITGIIVFLLHSTEKTTKSLVVKSDLMHYKMDFLTNGGILISLIVVKWTGFALIDPILAIGIAIYIFVGCWRIIKTGIDILMDKSLGKDKEIGTIILNHPEIKSFHKLKTHQSGGKIFMSFHLVFKNPEISLKEAHFTADALEKTLKKKFKRASIIMRLDAFEDD